MAQPPEDESFFSRWSKRKRATPAPEEPQSAPADDTQVEQLDEESLSPEELAALPNLEEFTPETDIRPFLRKGVPQTLRNAALRKMWMLTPAIRDYKNPAVDYAWDWNTPGGVPGDGLAPTPARAAEMLRDLLAPRRDAAPANAPETGPKEAPAPSQDTPDAAPQHSVSTPDSGQSPAVAAPDTKPEKSEVNQSGNDLPLPRKRHGGALPD